MHNFSRQPSNETRIELEMWICDKRRGTNSAFHFCQTTNVAFRGPQIKHMHKQTLAARSRGPAFKSLCVCTSPLSCQCGLILQKLCLHPLLWPQPSLNGDHLQQISVQNFVVSFTSSVFMWARLVQSLLTDVSACVMYACVALICLPYLPWALIFSCLIKRVLPLHVVLAQCRWVDNLIWVMADSQQ